MRLKRDYGLIDMRAIFNKCLIAKLGLLMQLHLLILLATITTVKLQVASANKYSLT